MEKYPFVPGHEAVGIVTAIGSEVNNIKIGDRVGFGGIRKTCEQCEFCKEGNEVCCTLDLKEKNPCGPKYFGGFATHIQQPAQWLFKIPAGIPDEEAAPHMCASETCYAPIARYAKPGDKVAILGMGGLGHLGVKLAKAWGCTVTAFTSKEKKVESVKSLGADEVVVITDETLKQEKAKYDFVLNTITIAYERFDRLLSLTKPMGVFCQVGIPKRENTCDIWAGTLVLSQINFVGSLVASRKEVREMLDFIEKHKIKPVCEYYEFNELPKGV